jgi:hypothetical protein
MSNVGNIPQNIASPTKHCYGFEQCYDIGWDASWLDNPTLPRTSYCDIRKHLTILIAQWKPSCFIKAGVPKSKTKWVPFGDT